MLSIVGSIQMGIGRIRCQLPEAAGIFQKAGSKAGEGAPRSARPERGPGRARIPPARPGKPGRAWRAGRARTH